MFLTQELMADYPISARSHVGDARHQSSGSTFSYPLDISFPNTNLKLMESEGNGLMHFGVWMEQGHPDVRNCVLFHC